MVDVLLRLLLGAALALPFLLPALRSHTLRAALAWSVGVLLAFTLGLRTDPQALARLRVDDTLLRGFCVN
jgi:hypothetical protein